MSTATQSPLEALQEVYDSLPSVDCKRLCAGGCTIAPYVSIEASRMYAYTRSRKPVEKVLGLSDRAVRAQAGASSVADALSREMPVCPLLRNGSCTVHPVRPLICRLFGISEMIPCPHGCEVTPALLTEEQTRAAMARVGDIADAWEAGA